MANKFTRFLSGAGSGILNPKGNLGDPRHASRMFVDDAFARAPRTKFLFHVFFEKFPKSDLHDNPTYLYKCLQSWEHSNLP